MLQASETFSIPFPRWQSVDLTYVKRDRPQGQLEGFRRPGAASFCLAFLISKEKTKKSGYAMVIFCGTYQ